MRAWKHARFPKNKLITKGKPFLILIFYRKYQENIAKLDENDHFNRNDKKSDDPASVFSVIEQITYYSCWNGKINLSGLSYKPNTGEITW